MSARIAIPYWSGAGHTAKLAQAIAEGAGRRGVPADLLEVSALTDACWDKMHGAQAIVFGAPTYMGSAAAAFKAFMDETSDFWMEQPWRDKLAGGFTMGSAASGDKANTLISFATLAAQHGMIWIGQAEIGPPANSAEPVHNSEGFWLGLAATASRDKSELIEATGLRTAQTYGVRIAESCLRWGNAGRLPK
ncbi:flavodoxin family protein [Roseobacteraceae bacterium S113]